MQITLRKCFVPHIDLGTTEKPDVIMGRCYQAFGEECSIRNLGTSFHDSRAFTDSPVSMKNHSAR